MSAHKFSSMLVSVEDLPMYMEALSDTADKLEGLVEDDQERVKLARDILDNILMIGR